MNELTDGRILDVMPGGIIDSFLDPWDCEAGDGDESRSVKADIVRVARAAIAADRQLRPGDVGMHVVGYINSTSVGLAFTENEGMARAWGYIGGSGAGNPVVRLSDAQAALAELEEIALHYANECSFDKKALEDAQAALAAKDAQITRLQQNIFEDADKIEAAGKDAERYRMIKLKQWMDPGFEATIDEAIAAMNQEVKTL